LWEFCSFDRYREHVIFEHILKSQTWLINNPLLKFFKEIKSTKWIKTQKANEKTV